ncbi:hypothetical protein LTS18_002566, partial [Coniosporium uncinatum]
MSQSQMALQRQLIAQTHSDEPRRARPQAQRAPSSSSSNDALGKTIALHGNGAKAELYLVKKPKRRPASSSTATSARSSSSSNKGASRPPTAPTTPRSAPTSPVLPAYSAAAAEYPFPPMLPGALPQAQEPERQAQRPRTSRINSTSQRQRSQPSCAPSSGPPLPPPDLPITPSEEPPSKEQVRESVYSIATVSTKLGEVPMRKWKTPYDYAAMEQLNKKMVESGWVGWQGAGQEQQQQQQQQQPQK